MHRSFYPQTLLHTDAFTQRRFYTFTHRRFYTQTLTHRRFYTQTLLHTDAFTHRHFSTQTLLHTDAFPSANETVTTMRVRHLNHTFCMQIMFTSKNVHRQSLSFPCCPTRTKDATQTKFQKCTSGLPSSPSLQLKQPSSTHCQRGCYQSSILSRC